MLWKDLITLSPKLAFKVTMDQITELSEQNITKCVNESGAKRWLHCPSQTDTCHRTGAFGMWLCNREPGTPVSWYTLQGEKHVVGSGYRQTNAHVCIFQLKHKISALAH